MSKRQLEVPQGVRQMYMPSFYIYLYIRLSSCHGKISKLEYPSDK